MKRSESNIVATGVAGPTDRKFFSIEHSCTVIPLLAWLLALERKVWWDNSVSPLFVERGNSASSVVMLLFHHTQFGDLNMAINQRNNTGGMIRNLLINTISIFAVSYILSGIQVDSAITALVVAVVMAVLNVTLKPLLILVTIPLTIVTFGLFLLVVNVLVLYAAEALIDGFHIAGFWWALAFSLLVSFVNSILFGPGKN